MPKHIPEIRIWLNSINLTTIGSFLLFVNEIITVYVQFKFIFYVTFENEVSVIIIILEVTSAYRVRYPKLMVYPESLEWIRNNRGSKIDPCGTFVFDFLSYSHDLSILSQVFIEDNCYFKEIIQELSLVHSQIYWFD